MNRAERRRIARELAGKKEHALTREAIAPEAKAVYDAGYLAGMNDGRMQGIEGTFKSCYAAAILAARQLFHFGEERSIRLLREMDRIVHMSLSADELSRRLYKELGIKLDYGDGIEPFEDEEDIF